MSSILESIRESQNFSQLNGVKKQVSFIRASKPKNQIFVRVRDGVEWNITGSFFEDSDTKKLYLVDKGVVHLFEDELRRQTLYLAITKSGDIFLWPLKLDKSEKYKNSWNTSMAEAIRVAKTHWVRISTNQDNGVYDVFQATGKISEPLWPDLTFEQVLNIAFRDQIIDSPNHEVFKKQRGEF